MVHESYRRHEEGKCHKETYDMIVTIPNTVPSVGKMLFTIHSKKKYENSFNVKLRSKDYPSLDHVLIEKMRIT